MTKGIANIKQFTTMVRDMGIGLIVADQIPSSLSDFIKANVYTQICFNLSFRKDIQEMAYTLNLNEQQRMCIPSLKQGQAIAKIADCPFPFIIHVAPPERVPYISDAELESMTKTALEELNAKITPAHKPEKTDSESEAQAIQDEESEETENPLKEWERFLHYLKAHPDHNVSHLYKGHGISGRKGTRLKEQLKNSGLIREIRVSTGQRGRSSLRLELTEKGYAYINETQETTQPEEALEGRGSEEHKRLEKLIREHYESKGKIVIIEGQLKNKKIDVLVQDLISKKISAVEIQLTEKYAVENALKDFQVGCDEVLFICEDEKILEKVKTNVMEKVNKDKHNRIQYYTIDRFIPHKNNKNI